MDIREKAEKDSNWFEKMLGKIPGFKGYFDRELRRDADKLQREFIVKKLKSAKENINDLIKNISGKRDLSLLNGYDNLLKEVDRCISTVKYADRGYSGFFDLVKIKRERLDEVYEVELLLVERSEELLAMTMGVVDQHPEEDTV